MMNSQSVQTVTDPVFQSKMPLFDGTIAATVLSKPQIMPGFLDKQTLQYSGAYFTYDPRRKEGAGFTAPWSKPRASLLDDRSPVSHLSGMEGHNHLFYRQDSNSSEEEHSSSALCQAPEKQGFTIYTKSPGISNTAAATSVAVGKQKTRGENSSPPSEKSVYLAVPKPVYGHNPCCNDLGCVMGQRYGVEHSSPRIPSAAYKHEWMQSDAHYTESPPIQRKAQGTLLQQRGLQFGPSAEPLKIISVETCSPRSTRTLPAMIDPNFSSYPCTPARTMFGSLSEQSQRLQTSPRGYPGLHPSHPTYEHMTSEVYQERSPMSKYGHLTQYPVFYYPQANEEDQNSTQCKNMHNNQRDVPVILKNTISSPPEHYIVPQSLHGEIPLPSTETLSNHSFMQGFDYPCYAVPRFNASPIRAPIKGLHAPPSFHGYSINVSPSSQHRDHPLTSAASPHRDKQSKLSLPYMCRDPTSPARFTSQPGVSPPSIKTNRFLPTIPGLLIDQHILPPRALNMNRLMDCSSCESQVTWPKQPIGLPVSPVAWLPQSPGQSSDHTHAEVTNSAYVRKIIYSPVVLQENKYDPASSSSSSVLKGCLKRSISHPSPLIKVKEEDRDVCEVELREKRQKVEVENDDVGNKTNSPPMPVIDNVFSLASYQTYLQVSGGVCPSRAPQRTAPSSEHSQVKTKPDTKVKIPDRDEKKPILSLDTKQIWPDTPTGKPVAEMVEGKTIKVEKLDPSDTDNTVESPASQQHCPKRAIKQEPEGTSCDSGHILVIKKCEVDECESKTDESAASDEPTRAELIPQTDSSAQDDKSKLCEQVASLHSKPVTQSHPSESKLNFTNIPPRCLRPSTHKIILPDVKHPSRLPLTEKPPAQPGTVSPPKPESQKPVRKHFLELHNALCKLVSQSVSASSVEDLRTWLSQLQLTEPASLSTKVQKVSCLLGVKARELWLNEEMKTALHEVLARLREYTIQERCPFPHVMRTGAVFLPMLVIKELLFPIVQGSFIDQVLHKHKVELRPTTLSEEKILIQLHKRACSSRLRRLMSLKHLPDIYADVVNLLYYTSVCKHLGLDADDPAYGVKDDGSEETPVFSDISASPVSQPESHPHRHLKDQETESRLNRIRTASRVKSSSRRMFLDNSLSDEEAGDTEKTVNGGIQEEFSKKHWTSPPEEGNNRASDSMVTEHDSSLVLQSPKPENSWTCPLTLDELSSSPTDSEPEESSALQSPGHSGSPVKSKHRSGMILKLRKMFSEGLNRKRRASYKAVSETGAFADPSLSETDAVEGGVNSEGDGYRGAPKATRRWQRTGSFSPALRPLSSSSKRKHRSLSKIKYCPYLSACHSAEHRRRWVLRSAVQRACKAMRLYYPDLVGKKICHLYEEDDKSEVWYRGEVLRIHEAHTNPLKTIFEVRYDSEPEWKYYLELLIDYKKGWLKIED